MTSKGMAVGMQLTKELTRVCGRGGHRKGGGGRDGEREGSGQHGYMTGIRITNYTSHICSFCVFVFVCVCVCLCISLCGSLHICVYNYVCKCVCTCMCVLVEPRYC